MNNIRSPAPVGAFYFRKIKRWQDEQWTGYTRHKRKIS